MSTAEKESSLSKQGSRIRHYFSRDNLPSGSLDKSYKTKFFDTKGDSRFTIKTLGDEIKFNVRNTASKNDINKRESSIKPSPRTNVKYFKEANEKN